MSILAAFAVPHPPLLIPGVGDGEKSGVAKTQEAYERVARMAAALEPETFVVFSPHATMYRDYLHISPGTGARGDFRRFGLFGEGEFEAVYDREFVFALEGRLAEAGLPGGTDYEREPSLDHGTTVPLYFLEQELEGPLQIVRVGLSGLSPEEHFRFGQCVAEAACELDRRTVIIASGDLSHKLKEDGPYGFAPEGPEFDRRISDVFASGDFTALREFDEDLCDRAAECGWRSFVMMAGALDGLAVEAQLLSYEGPYGVGYGIASFAVRQECDNRNVPCHTPAAASLEKQQEHAPVSSSFPVALARATIGAYLKQHRQPTQDTPEIAAVLKEAQREDHLWHADWLELSSRRAGTFVSLHIAGELRGCIGTIAATTGSVIDEIIQNGVSAASQDPRFSPLTEREYPLLEYSVDVLGDAEPAVGFDDLDAQRYGVIVSAGYRRGLLLPALEGVDTPEQQVAIALSKAGIRPQENYGLERFEVVRYR